MEKKRNLICVPPILRKTFKCKVLVWTELIFNIKPDEKISSTWFLLVPKIEEGGKRFTLQVHCTHLHIFKAYTLPAARILQPGRVHEFGHFAASWNEVQGSSAPRTGTFHWNQPLKLRFASADWGPEISALIYKQLDKIYIHYCPLTLQSLANIGAGTRSTSTLSRVKLRATDLISRSPSRRPNACLQTDFQLLRMVLWKDTLSLSHSWKKCFVTIFYFIVS